MSSIRVAIAACDADPAAARYLDVLDLHSAEWTGPSEFRIAADATRFEMWECDVAARLGLGAAVDYLGDLGLDAVHALTDHRAVHLLEELAAATDDLAARLGRPLSLIAMTYPVGHG